MTTFSEESSDRRSLLRKAVAGLGALVGAVFALPAVAAVLDPVLRSQASRWRDFGLAADVKEGGIKQVSFDIPAGWGQVKRTVFLVRKGEQILAVASRCTHLGCRVKPEGEELVCPCHGGAFTPEGEPLRGPVTKPLERFDVRIQNGHVQVKA